MRRKVRFWNLTGRLKLAAQSGYERLAMAPADVELTESVFGTLQHEDHSAWQLGDVDRSEECLVARQSFHRHLPLRLVLKIDISERPAVSVLHDEAFRLLIDRPWRRETAIRHRARIKCNRGTTPRPTRGAKRRNTNRGPSRMENNKMEYNN
jgi:hypothetical protein